MGENEDILKQVRDCCDCIQKIISPIVMNDIKVSHDDDGIAQIWCRKQNTGVTWDERAREKELDINGL